MMSYAEDLASLARLEKLRLGAIVLAVGCSLAGVLFDLEWVQWPRALLWCVGGVFAWQESRVEKRLGRDPDGSRLRAALFFVLGVTLVVIALKE